MTGEEAAAALAEQARRSISRRDLERYEGFDEVSPGLGELDEAAFDDLFERDQRAALDLLSKIAQATDRELAALARRLAGRVLLDLSRTGPARARGVGRLRVTRANSDASDLDVDASLEAILDARAQGAKPHLEDLWAPSWQRPDTAICLLVDRSGSMGGDRLAAAALAAAVCAWRAPAQFAVLAFGDTCIEIKGLHQTQSPEETAIRVLTLRGHGTTDVATALWAARAQLAHAQASRRITVLLSDAESTAGEDPAPVARMTEELAVIAPADELHHARALVAHGGKLAAVDSPLSVIAALHEVLS